MIYRTLIFAKLVQESALTTGGNQPHLMVDLPLARDGRGRPVIRGSTLAGCFIATARAIKPQLPASISRSRHQDEAGQQSLMPSAWRFAHAHIQANDESHTDAGNGAHPTVFLQHVAIDSRTLAAKDDHVFSLEAMPPGTCWSFELEISSSEEESSPSSLDSFNDLEALAAATLSVWKCKGGARLGRASGHGYGWCHLEDIVVVRLTNQQAHLWPDAFAAERSRQEWVTHFSAQGVSILTLDDLLREHADRLPYSTHYIAELSGTIEVGERKGGFGAGYGIDTLSIGGHAQLQLDAASLYDHINWPKEGVPTREEFQPDFMITALPDEDRCLRPFVPGASIRGVWRNHLERYWRAQGRAMETLEALFGSTEKAGCLRVADAVLKNNDWRVFWHQHVAIDELSGGAYGAAKFDRLSLASGCFHWRALIEAESEHEAQKQAEIISELIERLGEGHLPLGGGVWRGHGHVRWQLERSDIRPLFGKKHP